MYSITPGFGAVKSPRFEPLRLCGISFRDGKQRFNQVRAFLVDSDASADSMLLLLRTDHMSIRRKVWFLITLLRCRRSNIEPEFQTIEVMTLLYEAAKKAHKDDLQINSSALNPTTGVKRRHPDMLRKIVWRPDPNQPSHGVFVATDLDPNSDLLTDLAPNTLITGTQDPSPRDQTTSSQPPLQTQHESAAGSNPAQPIGQWSNPGTANGENVTYLHLDPALTYLPDMPEIPASTGEAYDTAMLLNMFDQAVSLHVCYLLPDAYP